MNIIIPLCGRGSRFAKYKDPKPFIKVNNKYILMHTIDNLKLQGNDTVYIVCHTSHLARLHDLIHDLPRVKCIAVDHYTAGAAETLQVGLGFVDSTKPVLVVDGDTFYNVDIIDLVRGSDCNQVVCFQCDSSGGPLYSYVLAQDGVLVDIREKEAISNLANTGAYYFVDVETLKVYCNSVLESDFSFRGEYYTSCVIKLMISDGITFKYQLVDPSHFVMLGTPQQVLSYRLSQSKWEWLFDLDGTLVVTDHIYFKVWKHILKDFYIDLNDHLFRTYIQGNSDSTVITDNFNLHVDPHILSQRKDALFKEYIDEIRVVPGAVELLHELVKWGQNVCIVTNCNRVTAELILKHMCIPESVLLVIGGECAHPKPYPHPYLRAMELLGSDMNRTIVFEDSSSGLLSARSAGCPKIIGVHTDMRNDQHFYIVRGANMVISDYLAVSEVLEDTFTNVAPQTGPLLEKAIQRALICNGTPTDIIKLDTTKLKGGYIADVMSVKADNLELVCKMENTAPSNLRTVAVDLDLYNREYYFYEAISNLLNVTNVRTPHFYGTVRDEHYKPIGLLLQNLGTSEYILAPDLNNEPLEVSLKVIQRMAELHNTFWGKGEHFSLLKRNNDSQFNGWTDFIQTRIAEFCTKWGKGVLTSHQLELAQRISNNFRAIQDKLSNGNLTLCHGDIKSGNLFFRKADMEPYFIDWQYLIYGRGVQDLVFFLIESYKDTKYTDLFKEYYFTQIDCPEYTKQLFEYDFKLAICYYPFFVGIWFGTTPQSDLIDVNFPYFYIKKLFNFMEKYIDLPFFDTLGV